MLVDSHCHLDFAEFNQDFAQILERAQEAGVGIMQTICTKMSEFPRILEIASKYDNIFASIGVHPNEVASHPEISVDDIVAAAKNNKVIGIGETGLDFYYEHSPKEKQISAFKQHIAAARITKLPLIIHTRGADKETIEILQEEMAKGAFTGLIHCFSTSKYLADEAIKLGFYISISGIITFKKAEELREIVKTLPLSRLLVETDSPYLAPVPYRGKRNEPAFVKSVAECLAELLALPYAEIEQQTTNNFLTLFNKVTVPASHS